MASQDLSDERLNLELMENIILGVAHELNNPNTFVRMNAMNIKKMVKLISPCIEEYTENHPGENLGPFSPQQLSGKLLGLTEGILDASLRIISISDKLKNCTQFSHMQADKISLTKICEDNLRMHQFLISRCAQHEINYAEDQDFIVEANQLQLEQALSILVTNACDAIQERFKGQEDLSGRLAISLSSDQDYHVVSVKDNGGGVPTDIREKIFSPFFTTKPQGVGDGLGLSICKSIVNKHGGKVVLEVEEDEGSDFKIFLPKLLN